MPAAENEKIHVNYLTYPPPDKHFEINFDHSAYS